MNHLIDRLRADLSEGRFLHSLGAAACARTLAERFGCKADSAYIAGLLHDCATRLSADQMSALARDAGLCSSDETCADPVAAYHAKLGAVVAKRDYGIDDPEILQAIAHHQIGSVPMTRLDMIIGLADAIEPSRKGEQIDALRRLAENDLLRAYTEKCRLYISNILKSGKSPSAERVCVYRYLLTLAKLPD